MTEDAADEYRSAITKAVIKAILEQSAVELGGEKAGIVNAGVVCYALTDIMAGLVASDPECNTARDARIVADAFRKGFYERLKGYLDHDGPIFPAEIIVPH